MCCFICTTITNCKVLAQLLWLGSPFELVFECICRSKECILSFKIRKLQHMILYSTSAVSYAWYVIHINFHVVFRCILCWHQASLVPITSLSFSPSYFYTLHLHSKSLQYATIRTGSMLIQLPSLTTIKFQLFPTWFTDHPR